MAIFDNVPPHYATTLNMQVSTASKPLVQHPLFGMSVFQGCTNDWWCRKHSPKSSNMIENRAILFTNLERRTTFDAKLFKTVDRHGQSNVGSQSAQCDSARFTAQTMKKRRRLESEAPSVKIEDNVLLHATTVRLDAKS